MKSFTFTDASGFTATLTVVENGDGTLTLTMAVDESTGITGDVRALYLNTTNDADYNLTAVHNSTSDAAVTAVRDEANKVRWVESKDTNVNGEVIKENDGAFDAGFEFGTQGMSTDDVQYMEFTISSSDGTSLSLDSFDWTTVGLRVTSVGEVDGARDGSLKLTGEEDEPPVESEVDAVNDFGVVSGSAIANGAVIVTDPGGTVVDALSNDSDPDGDAFGIVEVIGANATSSDTFDAMGWSGWVDGSMGGEIRMNTDGRIEIADPDGDFAEIEFAITTLEYRVEDTTGATDVATVEVLIDTLDG